MRIQLVTPAPPRSLSGNRVTATRWARILRDLGHRVEIRESLAKRSTAAAPGLLIALHARKSFDSIVRYRALYPGRPLVVALTGTDLYQDLETSGDARRALEWADRVVTLQDEARRELPPRMRDKVRVIHQSAQPAPANLEKSLRTFDVCVIGHLRPVKDPFRAALAARALPVSSRIRVLHAGAALEPGMRARAEREMAENPRYRWLGEEPPWRVRRILGRSHAMVLSSLVEGGANVLSEALVSGLPVLASRIPGSIGMLGEDHPAYFEVKNTAELTALLRRCERRDGFLDELGARSRAHAPRYRPERERSAWRRLLAELGA